MEVQTINTQGLTPMAQSSITNLPTTLMIIFIMIGILMIVAITALVLGSVAFSHTNLRRARRDAIIYKYQYGNGGSGNQPPSTNPPPGSPLFQTTFNDIPVQIPAATQKGLTPLVWEEMASERETFDVQVDLRRLSSDAQTGVITGNISLGNHVQDFTFAENVSSISPKLRLEVQRSQVGTGVTVMVSNNGPNTIEATRMAVYLISSGSTTSAMTSSSMRTKKTDVLQTVRPGTPLTSSRKGQPKVLLPMQKTAKKSRKPMKRNALTNLFKRK